MALPSWFPCLLPLLLRVLNDAETADCFLMISVWPGKNGDNGYCESFREGSRRLSCRSRRIIAIATGAAASVSRPSLSAR